MPIKLPTSKAAAHHLLACLSSQQGNNDGLTPVCTTVAVNNLLDRSDKDLFDKSKKESTPQTARDALSGNTVNLEDNSNTSGTSRHDDLVNFVGATTGRHACTLLGSHHLQKYLHISKAGLDPQALSRAAFDLKRVAPKLGDLAKFLEPVTRLSSTTLQQKQNNLLLLELETTAR